MCDGSGIITISIILIIIVFVLVFALFFVGHVNKSVCCDDKEVAAPKERFTMPDDASFWTYNVKYRPLDADEYTKIYSAGWELISCTTENESYYPNCGPEAPRMERTVWHYAFHKKPEVL